LKILVLNYEYPPIGGGAGSQTKLLAEEFIEMGHKVRIITSHFKGLSYYYKKGGLEIIRVPAFRISQDRSNILQMFIYLISAFLPLIWSCLKWKPNIIFSFFLLPTSLLAYIQYLFFKIPYVVSLRGGDVPSFVPEEVKIYKYLMPVANKILKNANEIVAVSKDLKELAQKDFPNYKDKITFINNGIKINEIKKHLNEIPSFLFVGRLSSQKNLEFVINNFKNVREKYIFNIIGDGPLFEKLQILVKSNNLEGKVFFKGWQNKDEVFNNMQSSHFLILMSEIEGLSNSGLEAYANGLPIIASNVSGVRHFVNDGETGFLIEKDDALGFIKIIKKIIRYPKIALEFSENSKVFVSSNYNIKDSAASPWMEIYIK
jgi:glycosyltransferase involved in cell wall biosynthesis